MLALRNNILWGMWSGSADIAQVKFLLPVIRVAVGVRREAERVELVWEGGWSWCGEEDGVGGGEGGWSWCGVELVWGGRMELACTHCIHHNPVQFLLCVACVVFDVSHAQGQNIQGTCTLTLYQC